MTRIDLGGGHVAELAFSADAFHIDVDAGPSIEIPICGSLCVGQNVERVSFLVGDFLDGIVLAMGLARSLPPLDSAPTPCGVLAPLSTGRLVGDDAAACCLSAGHTIDHLDGEGRRWPR